MTSRTLESRGRIPRPSPPTKQVRPVLRLRERLLQIQTQTSASAHSPRDATRSPAATVVERNVYDGFDHVVENRKTTGGATTTTWYTLDPLDRTSSKTTNVGRPNEKTTTFSYLGLSGEVLDEQVGAPT
jgi:hypothetical protein